MSIHVYSLARREIVPIAEVRAVMMDSAASPETYYHACIDLFPLMLAPMTAAELDGQRGLLDWQPDRKNQHTQRYKASERLSMLALPECTGRLIVTASALPEGDPHSQSLPLLSSWKHWGEQLYGQPDFRFGFTETLRRDAVPLKATIGHHVHADCDLATGWHEKQLSLFSICADQTFETAFPGPHTWWTTQWHDMRGMPRSAALAYEAANPENPRFPAWHARVSEQCLAIGLPANQHVVMPSWFLHRASSLFDAPESYDDLFPASRPQPKAYISHATLCKPAT